MNNDNAQSTEPLDFEGRSDIRALVFDIVGTLVDEFGTIERETARVLVPYGVTSDVATQVATDWTDAFQASTEAIAAGKRSWVSDDDLRRELLIQELQHRNIELRPDDLDHLASVGRRLAPWPAVSQEISNLAQHVPVVGLTNAGFAQALHLSFQANLRWHVLLSTELIRTYKPDPAAYQLAIDKLDLDARHVLFVAAHPWDLRAAAAQGFRTAYIPREHSQPAATDDRFDIVVETLSELEPMLSRKPGSPGDSDKHG